MTKRKTQTEQSKRFIDTAHELECDEDEDRFNATLKRIAPRRTRNDDNPDLD